jgi:hypothetical protein
VKVKVYHPLYCTTLSLPTLCDMRKRDRVRNLLSSRSPRPPPQTSSSTAPPIAQAPATNPITVRSSTTISTSATADHSSAFEIAIKKHIDKLPESEKDVFFRAASHPINEHDLLAQIQQYDAQHAHHSSLRPQTERLSRVLGILDRFMGGVVIAIQANPDLSSIIVGGIRVVIDLAIDFVQFFDKLTDMLCQLQDYLAPLSVLAKAGKYSQILIEALVDAYADILDFCWKARKVFVDSDGKRKTWTSWRAFLRQQWEPFETGFGKIKANMQHHLDVLQLASHAQQLSNDQKKEREDFLNWISPREQDHEEAHDNIFAKKHPGTGDWLLRTKEFRNWVNSSTSSLLWCHGKRESSYKTSSFESQI